LERGSVRVSNDRELSYMFDVEETFGRLELYLDHLDMDLSEYLSQAITTEMDACVSKTIGPPKKGLVLQTRAKKRLVKMKQKVLKLGLVLLIGIRIVRVVLNYLKPVLDMNLWHDQSMYSTVLPPKPKIIGTVRDGSEHGGNGEAQQGSAGAGGSKKGSAYGSKRKAESSVGTQKSQMQTLDDLVQTLDQDQVEQTQEQAKIDLTYTQVE
nr:peroxidase 20 [Tanacetum cinerariifolium]